MNTQPPSTQIYSLYVELKSILNLQHELCRLSESMDWTQLKQHITDCCRFTEDCSTTSFRLIAGLVYLKHIFHVSDQALLAIWIENPYWQYFCGAHSMQYEGPIDLMTLEKWRKRLGKKGYQLLLRQILHVRVHMNTTKKQKR